jgi:outer membrane protein assembly factor BamB
MCLCPRSFALPVLLVLAARPSAAEKLPVVLETVPSGAHVRVDGKEAGRTPVQVSLRTGTHVVELNAPRHEPVRQKISVVAGRENRFRVQLVKSRRRWSSTVASPRGAPLVAGEVILFRTRDALVALDARTGQARWRHQPPGRPTGLARHGSVVLLSFGEGAKGGVTAIKLPGGEEAWRAETRGAIEGPPAILAEAGLAIVASSEGRIYAWDATSGERRWEADQSKRGKPNPTPAHSDVFAYFATDQGWAYGFNKDGQRIWEFRAGNQASPAPAVRTPLVLVRGGWGKAPRHRIHALDHRIGSKQWTFTVNAAALRPVSVAGNVILVDAGTKIYGVRPVGGVRIWETDLGAPVAGVASGSDAGPVVAAGNLVRALDASSGKARWEAKLEAPACTPVRTPEAVFVAAGNEVLAFDAQGARRWSYRTPHPVCEIAAGGGVVAFASGDTAYVLDAGGE